MLEPLLDENEVAKILNESAGTLQRHRRLGTGPRFVRISERRVAYRPADVQAWIEARTASRIDDPVPGRYQQEVESAA
jgi:predicted DNA-binding transcriptional regulator AlpA